MFFDYFYEHEAEQFAFYMIPKEIVEDKPFCELSDGSKLLYSIILDRVKLSRKNGWIDDKNRVYIIFTVVLNICVHNEVCISLAITDICIC